MLISVQVAEDPAGDPAVGSVDVRTSPSMSTATHSDADGHETPSNGPPPVDLTVHALAPPVGLVEVMALP